MLSYNVRWRKCLQESSCLLYKTYGNENILSLSLSDFFFFALGVIGCP
jgi:hypothetical protein